MSFSRYYFLLLCIFPVSLQAQITAQGQGGKTVIWGALGFEQQLSKKWSYKGEIAYSAHSDPDSWNPLDNSGVFTFRNEVGFRISKHFRITQGLQYAGRAYDEPGEPAYVHEVRLYPRIYHEFSIGRVKMSQALRFDFRFFCGPWFTRYKKPFEYRNRYLIKATVPLNKKEKDFFVGITEFFFATDQERQENGTYRFTDYRFTENRTSLYYRRKIDKPALYFDAGIMIQNWREGNHFNTTLLFQVDLIFINPFG